MKIERCYCPDCSDKDSCKWVNKYQRLPREANGRGGLGLCPRIKDGTYPTRYSEMDLPDREEE